MTHALIIDEKLLRVVKDHLSKLSIPKFTYTNDNNNHPYEDVCTGCGGTCEGSCSGPCTGDCGGDCTGSLF